MVPHRPATSNGVWLKKPGVFMFAPLDTRRVDTSYSFSRTATQSGDSFANSPYSELTFAPDKISSSAVSGRRYFNENRSAPPSISAPLAMSVATTSVCPSHAASTMGVLPVSSVESTLAPSANSFLTFARSPVRDAILRNSSSDSASVSVAESEDSGWLAGLFSTGSFCSTLLGLGFFTTRLFPSPHPIRSIALMMKSMCFIGCVR